MQLALLPSPISVHLRFTSKGSARGLFGRFAIAFGSWQRGTRLNPVQTQPDVTMKPITDLGDEPILDGIVMNIIHLPGIIGVISDPILPSAPLARPVRHNVRPFRYGPDT